MTAGLDDLGFAAKPLDESLSDMVEGVRGISTTLNTSSTSIIGEALGVTASAARETWEAIQIVYASQDILQARGDALTALCAQTGTYRRGATKSTVTLPVTLAASTTLVAGDMIAYVTGDPTARFVNAVDAVNASGSPANVSVAFIAETAGPVRANAGTLANIASPVTGWNAIVAGANPVDAAVGLAIETDAALRARQQIEIARKGSSTAAAIRAALSDLSGMLSATVVENDTDVTVSGVAPHAVGCYVRYVAPCTDVIVAGTLFEEKAAGIGTSGSSSAVYTDTENNVQTVNFTIATGLRVYVAVYCTRLDDGSYIGDAALAQALADYGQLTFQVGRDVLHSKLIALVSMLGGVVDVTRVSIDSTATPVPEVNFVIPLTEYATLDVADVTVFSTVVSGPP